MLELDRWHRQLQGVKPRPRGAPELAAELLAAVSRTRCAEGPELFRLNDRCNELLRELPVRHTTRLHVERSSRN